MVTEQEQLALRNAVLIFGGIGSVIRMIARHLRRREAEGNARFRSQYLHGYVMTCARCGKPIQDGWVNVRITEGDVTTTLHYHEECVDV